MTADAATRAAECLILPEMKFCRFSFPIALLALAGCSDMSTFSVGDLNPLKGNDPLRQADYNYFYKSDQSARGGPVTAADLVGPDGRCAFAPAPVMSAP